MRTIPRGTTARRPGTAPVIGAVIGPVIGAAIGVVVGPVIGPAAASLLGPQQALKDPPNVS
ncbi:hypothetical protein GCM10022224_074390 [Nonomuraea antimicrobica]|uniref:Elastin n=1 Tax=Nonomuraea antimicrobica TaxID=561173 RepID=A0ABP7D0H3_9ACTN